MKIEFQVIAWESVDIPDDEANIRLINEKICEGIIKTSEELMEFLKEHKIEHDYNFLAENIDKPTGKIIALTAESDYETWVE